MQQENEQIKIRFIIVDDKSTDGTKEALDELSAQEGYDIDVVEGSGNLFWSKGMHKGIAYVKEQKITSEYYLLFNDDVEFTPGILERIVTHAKSRQDKEHEVYIGATEEPEGGLSYGGILYDGGKSLHYRMLGPEESNTPCSTFNANCVLIPSKAFWAVDNIDDFYKHSLGDFDYGFQLSRAGYKLYVYSEYVGVCGNNDNSTNWTNPKLPRRERLKLKESRKGLPREDWFHYLKKNFGFGTACIRSITPYIKILLRK